MSEAERMGYYYPNKMGRIILLGMEEILGRNGLNATLNMAELPELVANLPPNNLEQGFKFEQLSKIQSSLEKIHTKSVISKVDVRPPLRSATQSDPTIDDRLPRSQARRAILLHC